ncbi:MAG TPA: thioredoxin family protein [Puia sp.]|jgi:thioredoxin-related protein|nr:thioredoxin family protein [Puia sp.]
MRKTLFVLLIIPIFVTAQGSPKDSLHKEDGIRFETGMLWKDILAKAKVENKPVFVDCYATWCGPCKWMAKNIFTRKEVGDYFNSHFVCAAVQLDKTAGDDQTVKNWYSVADTLHLKYQIQDYPTYLFFSPSGELIHRFTGAMKDGNEFIAKATEAIDTATQFYARISHWEVHRHDSAYLWKAYTAANELGDEGQVKAIGDAYLALQKDLFSKRNLQLIVKFRLLGSSKNEWFQFYVNNAARIDDSLDGVDGIKHYVAWMLRPTIYAEEITYFRAAHKAIYWQTVASNLEKKYPTLKNDIPKLIKDFLDYDITGEIRNAAVKLGLTHSDWNAIVQALKQRYPDYDFRRDLLATEVWYYRREKQWLDCGKAAFALIKHFGKEIDGFDMNNIVWDDLFLHCDNRKYLREASKWIKLAIQKDGESEAYLDTYANLLYKIGYKKKAIFLESKAVETAVKEQVRPEDIKTCRSNLEKMQAGKPTWLGSGTAS